MAEKQPPKVMIFKEEEPTVDSVEGEEETELSDLLVVEEHDVFSSRQMSLLSPSSHTAPLAVSEESLLLSDKENSTSRLNICEDPSTQSNELIPCVENTVENSVREKTLSNISSLRTHIASPIPDETLKSANLTSPLKTCEDSSTQSNEFIPYIDNTVENSLRDNTLSNISSLRTQIVSPIPDKTLKSANLTSPLKTCEGSSTQSNEFIPYIDNTVENSLRDNTLSNISSLRTQIASPISDETQQEKTCMTENSTSTSITNTDVLVKELPFNWSENAPLSNERQDGNAEEPHKSSGRTKRLSLKVIHGGIGSSPKKTTEGSKQFLDVQSIKTNSPNEDNTSRGNISPLPIDRTFSSGSGGSSLMDMPSLPHDYINMCPNVTAPSYFKGAAGTTSNILSTIMRQELEIEEDAPPRRWVWNEFVDQNRKAFVIAVGGTLLVFLLAIIIYGCIHLYKLITQ